MSEIELVVNSDDYGYTPGVSRGILRAFNRGLLTSTTVMTTHIGEREYQWLGENQSSGLGVGLHFNLTKGPGLSEAMRKLNPESMPGHPEQLTEVPREVIAAELNAQLHELLERDIEPDHLDTHHYAQNYGQVFEVILDKAEELDIGVRTFGAGQRKDAADTGVPTTAATISEFYDERATRADLFELLEQAAGDAPESVELICHPGTVDDELAEISSYRERREHELEILTDQEVIDRVRELGFRPVNWTELG